MLTYNDELYKLCRYRIVSFLMFLYEILSISTYFSMYLLYETRNYTTNRLLGRPISSFRLFPRYF